MASAVPPPPAPAPAPTPARPGLRQAAVAFRYRNFALFWGGALLSNTGTWIQHVTVPFVLFELTGSATWLGFAAFVQFLPAVFLGPLAGSLADRVPRRSLLLVTQTVMAGLALLLWALWTADLASPGVIVIVVTAAGVVAGLNIPSWQAFVSELVPRSVLLNAVTLNSAQFNASRALGPAIGGMVIATSGPGAAFLVNGLSYGAVLAALALVRVPPLPRVGADRPRLRTEFAATVAYVRARPGMAVCVVVVVALGLLGSPVNTLIKVFADEVFRVGDTAYGFLGAALGAGSVLGAPLVAGRGSGLRRSRLTGVALLVYGAALAAFALAPAYLIGVAALLVAGAGYLAIASTLNTTLQLLVDETMRGKVIALYLMGLTGSIPLGSLLQGWLADVVGARATVAGAAVLFLAVSVWLGWGNRLLDRMDDGPDHETTLGSATDAGADPGSPGALRPAPA